MQMIRFIPALSLAEAPLQKHPSPFWVQWILATHMVPVKSHQTRQLEWGRSFISTEPIADNHSTQLHRVVRYRYYFFGSNYHYFSDHKYHKQHAIETLHSLVSRFLPKRGESLEDQITCLWRTMYGFMFIVLTIKLLPTQCVLSVSTL